MGATYFEATREWPEVRVAVMRELPPVVDGIMSLPHEDEELEVATFPADRTSDAAGWLVARGCSGGEAARIVLSALGQLLGQSTGGEPCRIERVLGTTI